MNIMIHDKNIIEIDSIHPTEIDSNEKKELQPRPDTTRQE